LKTEPVLDRIWLQKWVDCSRLGQGCAYGNWNC